MQYPGKVSGRTQSSVVDVHFGFTKCSNIPGRLDEDPDFRCRCLGIYGQLMEDLVFKFNLLMESMMQLTILSILVTVFALVEVVSLHS